MARTPRWVETDVTDGYGQVRFLKWQYFVTYISDQMLDFPHYIWRGQRRDDWKLSSTFDRLAKSGPGGLALHLDRFQYASRGRRGPNPPVVESENDWWALGQHHGLATPLLDWTTSPFTAAYFAFMSDESGQTKYRAVYALHRPQVLQKVDELVKSRTAVNLKVKQDAEKSGKPLLGLAAAMNAYPVKPAIEFIRPKSDENQRLVSQGGLFSRAPAKMSIDDWVTKNFVGETTQFILMKFLIPNKDREIALRTLNRMNINHATLFPDLYGASRFCNTTLGIENY